MFTPPASTTGARNSGGGFNAFYGPRIYFRGTRNIVYPGIAGTSAADAANRRNKFTRSAGTWIPGELKNKFITIQSGSGAGSFCVVYDNTDTEAYFLNNVSFGACSINIEESATTLLTDSNGGSFVSQGICNFGNDGLASTVNFEWCNFGTIAKPWKPGSIYQGNLSYRYCNFIGGIQNASSELGVYLIVDYCAATFKSSVTYSLVAQQKGVSLSIYGCVFWGTGGSAYPHMLYVGWDAIVVYMGNTRFFPDAGFTGAAIMLDYGGKFYGYNNWIDVFCSDQGCLGLYFNYTKGAFKGASRMCINNCSQAIRVRGGSDITFDTGFPAPISGTNLYGWALYGSHVRINTPESVLSTNNIYMSPSARTYPYSLLANLGDKIVGAAGESLEKVQI
jgi:hypothetical protein